MGWRGRQSRAHVAGARPSSSASLPPRGTRRGPPGEAVQRAHKGGGGRNLEPAERASERGHRGGSRTTTQPPGSQPTRRSLCPAARQASGSTWESHAAQCGPLAQKPPTRRLLKAGRATSSAPPFGPTARPSREGAAGASPALTEGRRLLPPSLRGTQQGRPARPVTAPSFPEPSGASARRVLLRPPMVKPRTAQVDRPCLRSPLPPSGAQPSRWSGAPPPAVGEGGLLWRGSQWGWGRGATRKEGIPEAGAATARNFVFSLGRCVPDCGAFFGAACRAQRLRAAGPERS